MSEDAEAAKKQSDNANLELENNTALKMGERAGDFFGQFLLPNITSGIVDIDQA